MLQCWKGLSQSQIGQVQCKKHVDHLCSNYVFAESSSELCGGGISSRLHKRAMLGGMKPLQMATRLTVAIAARFNQGKGQWHVAADVTS